jgi:subtilase family serine protease
LKIADVKVDPVPHVVQGQAVLVRGTTYTFRFEVENAGQAPVAGAVVVSIDYGCQGPGIGATGDSVSAGANLTPGERRTTTPFRLTIPVEKFPGTCKFEFKVDPANQHAESDERETSNVWRTTVAVH